MEQVYKVVTEKIRIECESFKSVTEQVELLSDARKINIEVKTWMRDGNEETAWYIEAERPQPDTSA